LSTKVTILLSADQPGSAQQPGSVNLVSTGSAGVGLAGMALGAGEASADAAV